MGVWAYIQPFGVDLFCTGKKFLVFNLVSRNLKSKYRRSIFGVLWTLIAPMAMAGVYYIVFKVILKVTIPHYLAFILSGVLPWNFFAQTVGEGMESVVGSGGLLSKVPIPVQMFPFVGAVTNIVTLALAIPVLIGGSLISSVPLGWSLCMLVFYCTTLFLLTYCISLILAIGFVFFRDLRHLIGILLQLWFYSTPVIYGASMVPEKYRWALYLNPLADIFAGLHRVLAEGGWPDGNSILRTAAWCLVFVAAAALVQKYASRDLVEQI